MWPWALLMACMRGSSMPKQRAGFKKNATEGLNFELGASSHGLRDGVRTAIFPPVLAFPARGWEGWRAVTVVQMIELAAAAMVAGAMNAVAGGGTLVTFPTLILTG